MKLVRQLCRALALNLFLASFLFAEEPAELKAKSEKAQTLAGRSAISVGAKSTQASFPLKLTTPVARSSSSPRAPLAQQGETGTRQAPAVTGTLGLFTLETGETLPRKAVGLSVYVNKIAREPGSISVVSLGWNISYGISDRVSAYFVFEPHRHIHVSRPGRLSLNAPLTNPQFQGTIYRSLTPVPGSPPGYIEDFPFAGHNGGGLGDFTLGVKYGLLSERKGDPIGVSLRADFIIPSRTSLSDLLDVQGQNGTFNFNAGLALSKTVRETATIAFNGSYRYTRDPEFSGGRAFRQADQIRGAVGAVFFPQKRLQLITEYSGLVFVGAHTQNTSFGARDPVEVVAGARVYLRQNVAVDLAYRNVVNLRAHGDRNGFVVKLAATYGQE